jgi:hypothetical protein
MSVAKKIISNVFETLKEGTKDSVRQITDTISPEALLKAALNKNKKETNMLGDYLSSAVDPSLTGENLKAKENEFAQKDASDIEKVRQLLNITPEHMKLPRKPEELRPYEQRLKEEEEKKARAVEAQNKSQQTAIAAPIGKQARGSLFAKKRHQAQSGFEGMKKDSKSG